MEYRNAKGTTLCLTKLCSTGSIADIQIEIYVPWHRTGTYLVLNEGAAVLADANINGDEYGWS
jgi:hypothetical protein